jgi:hypothetical protein
MKTQADIQLPLPRAADALRPAYESSLTKPAARSPIIMQVRLVLA